MTLGRGERGSEVVEGEIVASSIVLSELKHYSSLVSLAGRVDGAEARNERSSALREG